MTLHPTVGSIDVRRPAAALVEPGAASSRVAGGFFLLIGGGFITVTMLAASMAPGYDYSGGAISDLGTIPETALLFNGLLVLVGLMNAAGGYFLYRTYGGLGMLGVFAVAGIGSLGAGLMPLDTGDVHSLFALLAFLFMNLEAILAARVVRGTIGWLGLVAGAIGLVYAGLMVIGDGGNPAVFGAIGHGGAERMIAYPVMLWLIAVGGYLLAVPDRPEATPGP